MQVLIKTLTPLLVIGLALGGCTKEKKEESKEATPVAVSIYRVGKASQSQQLSYSGSIEPDNVAQIGFAVGGVVNNVMVQEGQRVKQGQLLASIDATEYEQALAIAEAGLEQAEDMYNRLNELYKKGSLPAKDFIDIKTKVAQARANKNINAKHISDSRLHAPMAGIISVRAIERGSMAAPGVPAFTMVKNDQVYARFSVPESEVGGLKAGMPGWVYIPTLADTLKGNISIINPQADPVSRTYTVKIRIANNEHRLMPGMLTETTIMTGKEVEELVVPAKSVVRDVEDLSYVYLVGEGKKVVKRRVETGRLTGNGEVVIRKGIKPGDTLVIAGQSGLKDGSEISF
ncbi:membrane fusion protein (multidrug efflux system) [Dyadobacter jejuensis]|uniref:Membrane fusion protein (Multidrug efflux system) n=1 Tax=Dyadobacter jejuensis TaxID=1082580 RepID=A0A316ALW2_9BACT|nr:efflux RND transporter periplasmic adaptor subunit [Dyadobacter jejuensis]PWJ58249.1 membrane fusion protein (multidrug efflux system) [Dyadobacter jejuensis]